MALITVKLNDFYYQVPEHEFSRYWLSHLDVIEVQRLPNDIPMVSKKAALKRGKGFKRVVKAYDQKGSGKHDPLQRS